MYLGSGGSGGGAAGACPPPPPHGSRFFRFDIQIFRNVAASGVGAPHEVGAPLREILDPLLLGIRCVFTFSIQSLRPNYRHQGLNLPMFSVDM